MHFFTDWEGPWIINDIAYELCISLFNNPEFFERLSQYDDYLYWVEKKPRYQAGDTLKLLAPFFVAADLKKEEIIEISKQTARFVKDASEAMDFLQKRYKPVVISTSYLPYLEITTKILDVDGDVYGTEFDPEKYNIDDKWKKWLLKKVDEIASLNDIEIENPDKKSVSYLNNLFWKELQKTPFKKVLDDAKVIGSEKKREIVKSYGEGIVITIGDSISDIGMFDYARKKGGLALSFNGNKFALEHANVALISESALSEALVVDVFINYGMSGLKKIDEIDHPLSDVDFELYFEVNDNVIKKSLKMRKKIRGKAGELG